jgi:hypothetical protein
VGLACMQGLASIEADMQRVLPAFSQWATGQE